MTVGNTKCDEDRIHRLFDQQLKTREEQQFERHLEQCESCRAKLEAAAARPMVWDNAVEFLRDSRFELSPLSHDNSTRDDKISGESRSDAWQREVKRLSPSDDPRMLGRVGQYEVVGIIGSGGMGVVLKALDPSLNRYVAIKILKKDLADSGSARKRFAREARAAASVVHENVIEIHGVSDVGDVSYLVMPYLRGVSLQKRLQDEGPLSVVEVLRVGMQAAAGLAAAHSQGLVHRDVKPANIMLSDGVDRVKLTDFGLARAVDDASITQTGVIAGTPQYMSPEQSRGESIDHRSDLFSLGSVLYAMCTGRPPFRADTSYGVMRRITDEHPTAIREINPNIPDWLCTIITTLMAKHPNDRFASASQVAELLEDCLAHVQQPTVAPLPASIISQPTNRFRFATRYKRSIAMISSLGLLAMVLWQATGAPDISGGWTSDDWGQITLEQTGPGNYSGTYANAFDGQSGKLQFKWSRSERRFNGTWREGEKRLGNMSLRKDGDQLRGAWTSGQRPKGEADRPRLADLAWTRPQKRRDDRRSTKMEVVGSSAHHNGDPWPASFPKDLVERLAAHKGQLIVPANVKVKELPDRYEVTAAPWRTITYTITDGHEVHEHDSGGHDHAAHDHEGEHSHEAHASDDSREKHDHSHDADHTHEIQQHEFFADEGRLIVGKDDKTENILELIGNAGFESKIISFSAQNMRFHLDGSRTMILTGTARFANTSAQIKMTADKITNDEGRTLLEGNARLRRNIGTQKPELISADRLEIDSATNSVKAN